MTGAAIRVLLVEDDPDDYETTHDVLSEIKSPNKFAVEWIPAYETALRAICDGHFDVCLLDYHLGDKHGLSFIGDAIGAGATVPIIFLTGRSDSSIEQSALALGASDYLVKGDIAVANLERAIRHSIERGRTLTQLRESERRFRAVFDHSLDAMLMLDDDGRYVDGNPAALSLMGVTRDQLLKMTAGDFGTTENLQRLLTNGTLEAEGELRRPDGGTRLVEYRAVANIVPGHHISVLRDLTERRRAEDSRLRLATVVDAADDAIDGMTPEGLINYWSPGAERLYGYSADEVIGQSKTMLLPPERRSELDNALRQLLRGEAIRHWESLRRRKDGTIFEASSAMSPIRERDRTVGVSVVTRDISEKKRMERHLAISDRMASIGTLSAGVAHEINNPLAALVANLEMAAEDVESFFERNGAVPPDLGTVRELLHEASDAARRIRDIVRDLRLFSRPDEDRRSAIDICKALDSSARMATNEVRHRAQLVRDFGDVPYVWGNDSRLGQVFLNLIINAAHAIREGDAGRNEITLVTRTDEAGMAIVEIRDTGQGIPAAHLPRLFEPFFTTKPIGIGTGLGLSICQRIVQELGGTLTVESQVGKGSVFRLCLPPTKETPATPKQHAKPTRSVRPGKILVVDDELMISAAVEQVLHREHDVTSVSAAEEALQRIRRGERYDVILCDLMMPQVTGMDLHAMLLETHPDEAAKMVFLTGGAFTAAAQTFLDTIPNPRIEKPFSSLHLRALVKERVPMDGG